MSVKLRVMRNRDGSIALYCSLLENPNGISFDGKSLYSWSSWRGHADINRVGWTFEDKNKECVFEGYMSWSAFRRKRKNV